MTVERKTQRADFEKSLHQTIYSTQFFYGKEIQKQIGAILQECGASKVLVLTGNVRLRSTGWYHQIMRSIEQVELNAFEFDSVEEEEQLEQIELGIAFCKKHGIDYVLAVGGGNVIDAAKAIAMGACCDNCIWTYFTTAQKPIAALPVSVVLTMPGSGSESNDKTMLLNSDTLLKRTCQSDVLQPQVCFVNPEIFYTISKEQLAYATVMLLERMIHSYLLCCQQGGDTATQERMARDIQQLIRNTYQLQINRMDDAAWNSFVLLERKQAACAWEKEEENSCRRMAAELSAMCQVPYGAVLAVILPAWMQFVQEQNYNALLQFSQQVMEVPALFPEEEQIEEGIQRVKDIFANLHLKDTLCNLGIAKFCLKNVAQICTGYGWGKEQAVGILQKLFWQDIYQIYQSVGGWPERRDSCLA